MGGGFKGLWLDRRRWLPTALRLAVAVCSVCVGFAVGAALYLYLGVAPSDELGSFSDQQLGLFNFLNRFGWIPNLALVVAYVLFVSFGYTMLADGRELNPDLAPRQPEFFTWACLVPILNIFVMPKLLRQAWVSNRPPTDDSQDSPPIINLFWFFAVATMVVNVGIVFVSVDNDGLTEPTGIALRQASRLLLISNGFYLITGILCFVLVGKLAERMSRAGTSVDSVDSNREVSQGMA